MGNCQAQTTFEEKKRSATPLKSTNSKKKSEPTKKKVMTSKKKSEPTKKKVMTSQKKSEPTKKKVMTSYKKNKENDSKKICNVLKHEMTLDGDEILNPKTLRLLKKDGRTVKDILEGCETIPKQKVAKYLQKQQQIQSKKV